MMLYKWIIALFNVGGYWMRLMGKIVQAMLLAAGSVLFQELADMLGGSRPYPD